MSARDETNTVMRRFEHRGIEILWDDVNALRRAELTLQRWAERECGDGSDWAIERDEHSGIPYMVFHGNGPRHRYRCPDREGSEIEGKYPDWQKVIPSGEREPSEISMSAAYLADYHKAQRALGHGVGVTISTNGPNSSIIVDICDSDVFCVLMPMRGESAIHRPTWLDLPRRGSFAAPSRSA